jgi:enamine deaminase RidA (YjgF/YER057c/UK114 family)
MSFTNPQFIFRALLPDQAGDFYSSLEELMVKLQQMAADSDAHVFRLVIFHDPVDEAEDQLHFQYARESLYRHFPSNCPTWVLTGHAPEMHHAVSIEAGLVTKGSCSITHRRTGELNYVMLEWSGYRELWAAGLRDRSVRESFEQEAERSFRILKQLLETENMSMNDIVRQWNYIGGIVHNNQVSGADTINYQIFNEIRHQYYQQYRTVKGFPAATGIGNRFNHVDIDICALQGTGEKLKTFAIENPNQVNPYQYGQQVLLGVPILAQKIKHPPEFERAKLVVTGELIRLFISGTASIIGQETIGIGDVEKQTHCTIENIEKLTACENVRQSYPDLPAGSFQYSFLRVYIKGRMDLQQVKSICLERFKDIPMIFVIVDICRDELLLEIEGEMHFVPEAVD